jgi:hypothetical protein
MKVLILLLASVFSVFGCTRFWVGGGSANTWAATGNTNWSTSSGGANNASVPTSTDDVCFDSNSGTGNSVIAAVITVKSLDCSGTGGSGSPYTGTLTHNAVNLDIENSLTLFSQMTYTIASASSTLNFLGSTSGQTVTLGGQSTGSVIFNGTGAWTLGSSLTGASINSIFTLTKGTFSTGNFAVTMGKLASTNSNTRSLSLGSSTLTLSQTGTVWDLGTTTGLTFSAGTSTIVFTSNSGAGKTFNGGGLTYNNVTLSIAGSGTFTFTGANTFNTLSIDRPPGGGVIFPASTTQTVTALSFAGGFPPSVVTFTSSSPGTQYTISQASGSVCTNYLNLTDSKVTGGASFFAGSDSTNTSDNSGWQFTACIVANQTAASVL